MELCFKMGTNIKLNLRKEPYLVSLKLWTGSHEIILK